MSCSGPGHFIPSDVMLPAGRYEYECQDCGHVSRFEVKSCVVYRAPFRRRRTEATYMFEERRFCSRECGWAWSSGRATPYSGPCTEETAGAIGSLLIGIAASGRADAPKKVRPSNGGSRRSYSRKTTWKVLS